MTDVVGLLDLEKTKKRESRDLRGTGYRLIVSHVTNSSSLYVSIRIEPLIDLSDSVRTYRINGNYELLLTPIGK